MSKNLTAIMHDEAERFGCGYVFWHIVKKFTGSHYADFMMQKYYQPHADKLAHLSQDELARYLSRLYKAITGDTLNLAAPEDYNQKIQWLKIYDNSEIKTPLSDKYAVREWITRKIGSEYLVPLLGVWDKPEDVNFDSLPSRFCLKANHGSGMNLVVRDKASLDIESALRTMHQWLARPYGVQGYEPQYFRIPRKIIAEEYIEQSDGDLVDYKIHCFDGRPGIIQVIGSRDLTAHTALEAFYSPKWVRNDLMYHTYEQYPHELERPDFLDDMLKIAATLSEDFRYVRVDLYHVNGSIKFGEMTFTPAGGFGKWASEESSMTAGDMIRIGDSHE